MAAATTADRVGVAALAAAAIGLMYGASGSWTAGRLEAAVTLWTPWDAAIPLWPPSVLLYLLLVPQAFAPAALIEDRRALRRAALGLVGMEFAFLLVWLAMPVAYPRVPLPVTDLLSWGVALTRAIDPPTNCFPSAHVGASVYAALVVRLADRRVGDLLLLSAAAIAASTVLMHQHWLADALVGGLGGWAAARLAFGLRPLPADAFGPAPRRRLWWLLGLYALLFLGAALPWWSGAVDPAALGGRWDGPGPT
jgi:membrane-associated phospholipid phosphatase